MDRLNLEVKHNSVALGLTAQLQHVIEKAKSKWLLSDRVPKSLELLDSMSIALLSVQRFIAEDDIRAVQISWTDDVFGQLAFEKAFYKQPVIYAEARSLREKILKAIIARIRQ